MSETQIIKGKRYKTPVKKQGKRGFCEAISKTYQKTMLKFVFSNAENKHLFYHY